MDLWSWCTVVPEASFEIGYSWGDLLEFEHLEDNKFMIIGDDEQYFTEKFDRLKPLIEKSGDLQDWGKVHMDLGKNKKMWGIEVYLNV